MASKLSAEVETCGRWTRSTVQRGCAAGVVGGLIVAVASTASITTMYSPAVAAPVEPSTSQCVDAPAALPGDVAIINITNTGVDGGGFGALRPSLATPVFDRPADEQYSSVNFAADTPPNPNLALVIVGGDNRVCYDGAVSRHDVILDLAATIPVTEIDAFDPRRIVDTRDGSSVGAGSSVCVGIDGAVAGDVAVINITNTRATGGGFGALRASDATPVFDRPAGEQYSSVNFAANTPPNPNLAFVTVGADGQVCYDGAVARHDVILDLSAVIPGSNINAFDPRRILDTRSTRLDIEIEMFFTQGHPVYEAFPPVRDAASFDVTTGYGQSPTRTDDSRRLRYGLVTGSIIVARDGTITGTGVVTDRRMGYEAFQVFIDTGETTSVDIEGFGTICPADFGTVPAPAEISTRRMPIRFTGRTVQRTASTLGYEIDVVAGDLARPGRPGALPPIEGLLSTFDQCGAAFDDCREGAIDPNLCGKPGFRDVGVVDARRLEYRSEIDLIDQTFIDESVFTFSVGQRLDVSYNTGADDVDGIEMKVSLGSTTD